MSIKNDTAPRSTPSRRNRWDPLADSEKYKFRVQNKPPLSLRQFLRSTIAVNPGGKEWKPAGIYRGTVIPGDPPPKASNDLPKIDVKSRKNSSPVWRPAGSIKYKRPASSKEESKPQESKGVPTESRTNTNSNLRYKSTHELSTPWYPSGSPYYESVPYFDAPSLRWSTQQIKKSMPELRSTTHNSPTN